MCILWQPLHASEVAAHLEVVSWCIGKCSSVVSSCTPSPRRSTPPRCWVSVCTLTRCLTQEFDIAMLQPCWCYLATAADSLPLLLTPPSCKGLGADCLCAKAPRCTRHTSHMRSSPSIRACRCKCAGRELPGLLPLSHRMSLTQCG